MDNTSDEEKNEIENEDNEMETENEDEDKIETENEDKEKIETKETLVIPENTTKWNLCTYQCCFCKRITMSRSSMIVHLRQAHELSVSVSILPL